MKTILCSLLILFSQMRGEVTEDMMIYVSNIKEVKGNIVVSLYNKADDFPKKGQFCKKVSFPIKGKTVTCRLKGIAKGEYAIAIYHDINSDSKFNQNFIGLPTEAYGFSKNVRPQFSVPDYDEVKINFPAENNFKIVLIHN
jgi:uncharacterized protein (DUF2141 family)